jgi:hypothetical protein
MIISISHWGMFEVRRLAPIEDYQLFFGEVSYDAKYLHGHPN